MTSISVQSQILSCYHPSEMPEQKLLDWQVPVFEADPARRQDWVLEQIQEGENWLESQNVNSSEANLSLLSAAGTEKLKSNSLKSDIRKFVETISDIQIGRAHV